MSKKLELTIANQFRKRTPEMEKKNYNLLFKTSLKLKILRRNFIFWEQKKKYIYIYIIRYNIFIHIVLSK